jgi:hypothetical protein
MSRLCRLSLAVAVVLAVAAPSAAAAPVNVQGDFMVGPNSGVTVTPLPGDRCLVVLDNQIFDFITGDLDGSFVADFDITSNLPCSQQPGGQQTFVTRDGTFSGSVAGVGEGSFDFVFRGTIDPEEHARGQLTITSASGGLAGLRGTIQLSGMAGVGGSYSGTLVH